MPNHTSHTVTAVLTVIVRAGGEVLLVRADADSAHQADLNSLYFDIPRLPFVHQNNAPEQIQQYLSEQYSLTGVQPVLQDVRWRDPRQEMSCIEVVYVVTSTEKPVTRPGRSILLPPEKLPNHALQDTITIIHQYR